MERVRGRHCHGRQQQNTAYDAVVVCDYFLMYNSVMFYILLHHIVGGKKVGSANSVSSESEKL